MIVAVINFSGNVGKTAVSRHLLAPRLGGGAPVFSVESINTDGHEDTLVQANVFGDMINELVLFDNVVIDVGASNAEKFLQMMKAYVGSHEEFDFFVIPIVPLKKQIADSIKTLKALNELGVPAKKVKVVFNMLEDGQDVEQTFKPVLDFWQSEKCFVLRKNAVMYTNELFGKIMDMPDLKIADLVADSTDYKALAKETEDRDEKVRLMYRLGLRRLAVGISDSLDNVFKELFSQPKRA